jgi:hypothetical protein
MPSRIGFIARLGGWVRSNLSRKTAGVKSSKLIAAPPLAGARRASPRAAVAARAPPC